MMDFAHELSLPLQRTVTATSTHYGPCIEISEEIWTAIGIWQHIISDEEAARVGKNIQERIDRFYHEQDKRDTGLESQNSDLPTS